MRFFEPFLLMLRLDDEHFKLFIYGVDDKDIKLSYFEAQFVGLYAAKKDL